MVNKKKVLHIAQYSTQEMYFAIENYLFSTIDLPVEHHFLVKTPKKKAIKLPNTKKLTQIKTDNLGLFAFFRQMKKSIQEIKPDIIHLHSSLAGFLGRFLPKGSERIIYTPHCYTFEKQNISPRLKMFFMWLETFKLSKIDAVAACSEREKALAYNLGAKQALYLNHYANITPSAQITPKNAPPFTIFIVGELNAQKDPYFLMKTIKKLKNYAEYKKVRFHWLGNGEQKYIRMLEKNKVTVSKLASKKEIINAMQKAHLYLHTSAWDGMSLSLLEAAKLHIPTIVRFTSALQGIPYPFIAQSPNAMALQIIRFIKDPYHSDYLTCLSLFNQHFTKEKQRKALKKLYSIEVS